MKTTGFRMLVKLSPTIFNLIALAQMKGLSVSLRTVFKFYY